MAISDWFRTKKKSQDSSGGVAEEIRQALSVYGISEEISEVNGILDKVLEYMNFEVATKGELFKSGSADLECVGPHAYNVHLNVELVDREGKMYQPALNVVASLAAQYITAGLVAQRHGRSECTLQPGDRIGLGDLVNAAHPLHKVLPGLVPISVPRG